MLAKDTYNEGEFRGSLWVPGRDIVREDQSKVGKRRRGGPNSQPKEGNIEKGKPIKRAIKPSEMDLAKSKRG